jgi:hypothetical protein
VLGLLEELDDYASGGGTWLVLGGRVLPIEALS